MIYESFGSCGNIGPKDRVKHMCSKSSGKQRPSKWRKHKDAYSKLLGTGPYDMIFVKGRARPQFAIWASISGLLAPKGQIIMADAKGGGREHYKFPIDDHWFNIDDEYMKQKGLSLWSIDPKIASLSQDKQIQKFGRWLDTRNLE